MTLKIRPNAIEQDFGPFTFPEVYVDGDLGIGTRLPQRAFHLVGSDGPVGSFPSGLGAKDFLILENDGNVNIGMIAGANDGSELKFYEDGVNDAKAIMGYWHSTEAIRLMHSGNAMLDIYASEIIINDGGNDIDFRVESDAYTHALFVDGGTNWVGIGCVPTRGHLEISNSGSPTLNLHSTTSGNSSLIEIGEGGTGNRYAYIDMVGDVTYTDYGLRILRGNTGANTFTTMYHRGTGSLTISTVEAAPIVFSVNSNIYWIISAGGLMHPNGAPGASIGDGTNYCNDVSSKNFTDRGCLGWYEDGVELQDGRIVSDVEALQAIKKHSTLRTPMDIPRIDYATLPKDVYKPVPIAEKDIYQEDYRMLDDDPVTGEPRHEITQTLRFRKGEKEGDDGAELTALISIMLGAIKELDSRLAQVEH